MADKIRLFIADDHAILREGVRAFFLTQPHIDLVGEAPDGLLAVELCQKLNPDVIIMDLVMPRKSGIDAIKEIISHNPEAKILVLTSFADDELVNQAVLAGAIGYLLKDSTSQQLVEAIENAHKGVSTMPPQIIAKLIKGLKAPTSEKSPADILTEKEKEVLQLVAKGLSNQSIANQLSLSEWTVRTHVRNILGKLHLENRTQATLFAIREGIAKINHHHAYH